MAESQPVLRWGILGAAQIARVAIAPALRASRTSRLLAVASRDASRAAKLARESGAARAYKSYEALLADPDVDVVYVPLPNTLHHEWTLKALQAGKHVLCEKPLAMSETEAREMVDAARRARRLLMEAFMYRFHPRLERVQAILREGEIGPLRLVKAFYTYRLVDAKDVRAGAVEDDIRLDPRLGGGALRDVGSYCANALRWYFRAEPRLVYSWADHTEPGTVDWRSGGILDFGEGRLGEFFCAMDTFGGGHVEILGERGRLTIPLAFRLRPTSEDLELHVDTVDGSRVERFPYQDQYLAQIDAFAAAVREGREAPISPEDAIGNARVLEALRRSWSDGPQRLDV